MTRKAQIFKIIEQRISDEHLKHVQPLLRTYNGNLAIKFTCCDSPKYKERIKKLCTNYPESLKLVHETNTVLIYTI